MSLQEQMTRVDGLAQEIAEQLTVLEDQHRQMQAQMEEFQRLLRQQGNPVLAYTVERVQEVLVGISWQLGNSSMLSYTGNHHNGGARRIEAIQGNRNPFIWGEVPSTPPSTPAVVASTNGAIVGNKRTKVYHRPDCPGATKVSQQNRVRFTTEAEAQAAGYQLAENCP
jgi:Metal binding domain of Ada